MLHASPQISLPQALDNLISQVFDLVPQENRQDKKLFASLGFVPPDGSKTYEALNRDKDYSVNAAQALYEALLLVKKTEVMQHHKWNSLDDKNKRFYLLKKLNNDQSDESKPSSLFAQASNVLKIVWNGEVFRGLKCLHYLDAINGRHSWMPHIIDERSYQLAKALEGFFRITILHQKTTPEYEEFKRKKRLIEDRLSEYYFAIETIESYVPSLEKILSDLEIKKLPDENKIKSLAKQLNLLQKKILRSIISIPMCSESIFIEYKLVENLSETRPNELTFRKRTFNKLQNTWEYEFETSDKNLLSGVTLDDKSPPELFTAFNTFEQSEQKDEIKQQNLLKIITPYLPEILQAAARQGHLPSKDVQLTVSNILFNQAIDKLNGQEKYIQLIENKINEISPLIWEKESCVQSMYEETLKLCNEQNYSNIISLLDTQLSSIEEVINNRIVPLRFYDIDTIFEEEFYNYQFVKSSIHSKINQKYLMPFKKTLEGYKVNIEKLHAVRKKILKNFHTSLELSITRWRENLAALKLVNQQSLSIEELAEQEKIYVGLLSPEILTQEVEQQEDFKQLTLDNQQDLRENLLQIYHAKTAEISMGFFTELQNLRNKRIALDYSHIKTLVTPLKKKVDCYQKILEEIKDLSEFKKLTLAVKKCGDDLAGIELKYNNQLQKLKLLFPAKNEATAVYFKRIQSVFDDTFKDFLSNEYTNIAKLIESNSKESGYFSPKGWWAAFRKTSQKDYQQLQLILSRCEKNLVDSHKQTTKNPQKLLERAIASKKGFLQKNNMLSMVQVSEVKEYIQSEIERKYKLLNEISDPCKNTSEEECIRYLHTLQQELFTLQEKGLSIRLAHYQKEFVLEEKSPQQEEKKPQEYKGLLPDLKEFYNPVVEKSINQLDVLLANANKAQKSITSLWQEANTLLPQNRSLFKEAHEKISFEKDKLNTEILKLKDTQEKLHIMITAHRHGTYLQKQLADLQKYSGSNLTDFVNPVQDKAVVEKLQEQLSGLSFDNDQALAIALSNIQKLLRNVQHNLNQVQQDFIEKNPKMYDLINSPTTGLRNFESANFTAVHLRNFTFSSRYQIKNSIFKNAIFTECEFFCPLYGVDFSGADLTRSLFSIDENNHYDYNFQGIILDAGTRLNWQKNGKLILEQNLTRIDFESPHNDKNYLVNLINLIHNKTNGNTPYLDADFICVILQKIGANQADNPDQTLSKQQKRAEFVIRQLVPKIKDLKQLEKLEEYLRENSVKGNKVEFMRRYNSFIYRVTSSAWRNSLKIIQGKIKRLKQQEPGPPLTRLRVYADTNPRCLPEENDPEAAKTDVPPIIILPSHTR